MQSDPDHEALRVVAIWSHDQLELVREDRDELEHLESGQVLLPPDVLLVFRAHRRHHVVKVHDNVNERVQHGEEGAVATCERIDGNRN